MCAGERIDHKNKKMTDSAGGKRSIKQAMDEIIAEVDRDTKVEADRKARAEAMRPVREQAEREAKEEAERQAKLEAERLAKEASERQAKEEAERAAKAEAERVARMEKLAQPAPRTTEAEPSASGRKAAEQVIADGSTDAPLTEMDMGSVDIRSWSINRATFEALGGKKGLSKIARDFYMQGVYVSPILGKLFAIKDDTHPHDLVLFLMHLMQVDDTYMKLRENSYYAVKTLHANARHNPERDRCPAGAGTCGGHWTVSQRDEWKNLFLRACTRNSVPQATVDELSLFVDRVMKFYGPFTADRGQ